MAKQNNGGWEKLDMRNVPPAVSWDETEEIIGKVVEKKEVEWNGEPRPVVVLETDNGPVSVWCSARLIPLFSLKEGTVVRIVNLGWVKTKTGRRARNFEIYYQPSTGGPEDVPY